MEPDRRAVHRTASAFLRYSIPIALLLPSHALAQAADSARCFRFDRPYFTWVGRYPATREIVNEQTAVIRFSAEKHAPHAMVRAADARVLAPLRMQVDSSNIRRWLGPSHWRQLSSDSLSIVWRNGLYGPVFVMQQKGDSLIGSVEFTTDVVDGSPPTFQPAAAVRIACDAAPTQ